MVKYRRMTGLGVPGGMHHPWEEFGRLEEWGLRWAKLPHGIWGLTDFEEKTVTLTTGLSQAERRCTIAHETQHILRGPVVHETHVAREEDIVDRNVARLLLPDVRRIADVLIGAAGLDDAAEELWVDEIILETRLKTLHPSERAYVRRHFREMEF